MRKSQVGLRGLRLLIASTPHPKALLQQLDNPVHGDRTTRPASSIEWRLSVAPELVAESGKTQHHNDGRKKDTHCGAL